MRESPDWQHGYTEQLQQARTDLRSERARGSTRNVYLPGSQWATRVCDLDDDEIEDAARDEAERDTQRAINEWNASESRQRRRAGEGQ